MYGITASVDLIHKARFLRIMSLMRYPSNLNSNKIKYELCFTLIQLTGRSHMSLGNWKAFNLLDVGLINFDMMVMVPKKA